MAMINPETQTSRLLRKAANLLNSVAEAAWTNDLPSPAKWDLHRIGTEAYLAQRDILALLGLPAVMAKPQADFDIAAALGEAAQVVATIPNEFESSFTRWLLRRVTVLAEREARVCSPACDASRIGGWSHCLIMSGCSEVLFASHNTDRAGRGIAGGTAP